MSARYHERVGHIESLLLIQNLHIDTAALREACVYGVPEPLRPLCWRLFLDLLPRERQCWAETLGRWRAHYHNLVEQLINRRPNSSIPTNTVEAKASSQHEDDDDEPTTHPNTTNNEIRRSFSEHYDHPLSSPTENGVDMHRGGVSDGSDRIEGEWSIYFKDNATLSQIDKDVRRLRPEIDFFQRRTAYPLCGEAGARLAERIRHEATASSTSVLETLSSEVHELNFRAKSFIHGKESSASRHINEEAAAPETNSANDCCCEDETDDANGLEHHWQVVERILFVYSKVNPGIKYVQGMNEIIGPLYYVFAADTDAEWAAHAEADAFYCFQNLMSEIKDNFIRTLDYSDCGIEALLTRFYSRFELVDPRLYAHLVERLGVRPQFYAFRWISLLLSQEFSLPDVIALWDTVFASTHRLETIEWLCLAMVENVRGELLVGDFGQNMRLLQNYPEVDVSHLVQLAITLKSEHATPAPFFNASTKSASLPGVSFTNTSINVSSDGGDERSGGGGGKRSSPKALLKSQLNSIMSNTRERVSKYSAPLAVASLLLRGSNNGSKTTEK